MLKDGQLYIAHSEGGNINLVGKMANRHGLIAGATGTGKTVTLQVLAETFSQAGVPCFMADMKGDLSGISQAGKTSSFIEKRMPEFGIENPQFAGCPTRFFDVFGEQGFPMRATVSAMGPQLLARLMQLTEVQAGVLNAVFRIADDNNLLLIDLKDLKLMLDFVGKNAAKFTTEYGNIASASVGAIQRAVLQIESEGGDKFFGEPAFDVEDLFAVENGRGVMNVLSADKLMLNPKLYSTFLLWLMTEIYSKLPEIGDPDLPKFVFFFDEAHLLFNGASKALLDKIEQVVKLIRSKGVGIYFCTQSPKDIPDGVLAQLGNKVQHALRAYTPADQRAVKAAAASYRPNPEFDTAATIMELGTGKAVVSFLGDDGIPGMVQRVSILPPQCSMGSISDGQRDQAIKSSLLYSKYANYFDRDSAYEFLQRQQMADAKQAEEAKAAAEQAKIAEREAKAAALAQEKAEKEAAREAERAAAEKNRVIKTVGSSVLGTVGRQVGRSLGGSVAGNVGKTVGGNLGASLIRGIFGTFFKG